MNARVYAGLPLSGELAWLIAEAPAALGESGTLGSTISALERGGGPGYPCEGSPGGSGYHPGDGQRWTELMARWRKLRADDRRVLLAYYSPSPRYPRVIAQGYPSPQPIGDRLEVYVGELGGVVAMLAVSDEARRRRTVAEIKRVRAVEEVDRARGAARDAVPHIVADLEGLRRGLIVPLHGRRPKGRIAARLDVLDASIRALAPSGARKAVRAYRTALVALAEAQALSQDRILGPDWRPLVRMVEKPERRALGDLRRRALDLTKRSHGAWDEA